MSCQCGCCEGIGVATPRQAGNPPGLSRIAMRVGTHSDFLSSMLARLSSPAHRALGGLTVRAGDDFSVAFLDSSAYLADLLAFYTERFAAEGYLRTATNERSLRLLGRLVGHVPRPGVSAGTYLAYTLDQDPTRGEQTEVTIPRGSRSQSVPGQGEEPVPFEIGEDLVARWAWNDLRVRQRRPYQLSLPGLKDRREVQLDGTANNIKPGDRLLFVFGTERGRQRLLVVPKVQIDQQAGITVAGLPAPALAGFSDLTEAFRTLVENAHTDPMFDRSRIVRRYVEPVLDKLVEDLPEITTPTQFGVRLQDAVQRLDETIEVAQQYDNVHRWLLELRVKLVDLAEKVGLLEPPQETPKQESLYSALRLAESDGPTAFTGLGALLGGLRVPASRPPDSPRDLDRDPTQIYGPGSDLSARLLAMLDARLRETLYPAWRNVDLTAPQQLQELQAMRVTATPFGATAPLKPVYDEAGRPIGQEDWPLLGNQVLAMSVLYDENKPDKAVFTWSDAGQTARDEQSLTSSVPEFDFGPGTVTIEVPEEEPPPPQPGVTIRFRPNLPNRDVFVSPITNNVVLVRVGDPVQEFRLAAGNSVRVTHGGLQLSIRHTPENEGRPATVDISFEESLALSARNVLALDAQYEGIAPGTWVVIQRPRKGQEGGVPGDPELAEVVTRIRGVRVVSRADFGITGKVTELTLETDWLDTQDTLLSHIRDATVYVRGQALALATEPITDDVAGNVIELAALYEGLEPGRWVVVTGERTDLPDTPGVTGTELTMIATVTQSVKETVPGDHVHTTITLATPLAYRYRRETVHIYANIMAATHGASKDEPIGSGDASKANQTFTLFSKPLTWLAADTPRGAVSTLEVRVDGVRWQEVDSLAGRGPDEKVYVTGAAEDGRTTVTFGDGIHGARLPTGQQNVRAAYRIGIGRAGNVAAGKVTQLTTRPLWVSGVNNPLPATGGADPDGPSQIRRAIPLSVTALDRLVSVPDYEDFARARAGIGRASARRLSDGTRELVHVTVTGVDDVPLAPESGIVRTLHSALAAFGSPQLPVQVAVRELVALVISAKIRVAPQYAWRLVEPKVRAALVDRLGGARRELGQPAYLSEAVVAAQAVPGVDHVDVDVFAGVPDTITPAQLTELGATLTTPHPVVPARHARFDEVRYTVQASEETLIEVAAKNGITVAELLRLNPDITDATRLPQGRSVLVFRGIRPAQLVTLAPDIPDTLILKEIR
ncbi:putative baseplate assembly protein [Kibdelosporangium aridum]|uniref:Putative baseplate assembly protein n=1 Tax=Kibdelosporangium aridum TaxID=2030 RepID=A0A1W1ZGX4_KIBAR|nr:putative baseplate assembly protein [Kibdelosporangium aridum]SMC47729.1 putative baseplate assembly protein [Kibdelosporangium aridum]